MREARAKALQEQAQKEKALPERRPLVREAPITPSVLEKSKPEPKTEKLELANILFDFDKYTIGPEFREVLKHHAEWLNKNSDYKLTIEGHCDERGTNEYNLALGERRANEAKKFLMSLGVDKSRIKTISYGEEMPVDPGQNEEAWAKNRRAVFVVNP